MFLTQHSKHCLEIYFILFYFVLTKTQNRSIQNRPDAQAGSSFTAKVHSYPRSSSAAAVPRQFRRRGVGTHGEIFVAVLLNLTECINRLLSSL